jgi:hypothetical protein
MPIQLDKNPGRFLPVRSMAAWAADTQPPTTLTDDKQFNCMGDYTTFYWTGTTPGGTMDITIWFYDGLKGLWVKGGAVSSLAPNTLATLKAYNASAAALLLAGAPAGTNFEVRAVSANV